MSTPSLAVFILLFKDTSSHHGWVTDWTNHVFDYHNIDSGIQ